MDLIWERRVEKRSINDLANQFDHWMKNYVESHKNRGHYEDNNKALIDWLNGDRGIEYIQDYSEFVKLAQAVAKKGYQTNPLPSRKDFQHALEEHEQRSLDRQHTFY